MRALITVCLALSLLVGCSQKNRLSSLPYASPQRSTPALLQPEEGWEERVATIISQGIEAATVIKQLEADGFVLSTKSSDATEVHLVYKTTLGMWVAKTYVISMHLDQKGRVMSHTTRINMTGP